MPYLQSLNCNVNLLPGLTELNSTDLQLILYCYRINPFTEQLKELQSMISELPSDNLKLGESEDYATPKKSITVVFAT